MHVCVWVSGIEKYHLVANSPSSNVTSVSAEEYIVVWINDLSIEYHRKWNENNKWVNVTFFSSFSSQRIAWNSNEQWQWMKSFCNSLNAYENCSMSLLSSSYFLLMTMNCLALIKLPMIFPQIYIRRAIKISEINLLHKQDRWA
jgi:hypothetical protein